jgi:sec-independent protein translocase protein TatB
MVGRWLAKARAMADQFKKSFDEMSRQAELDELRTELQALRNERPFAGIEQSLHEPVLPSDAAPKGPIVGDAGGVQGQDVPHDAAPSIPAPLGGNVPPP